MFSSLWIQNTIIYSKQQKEDNKFAKLPFIQYLRSIMFNEVLQLVSKKSVHELLFGYYDPLLIKLVKLKILNQKYFNYFLGGDPTIDPLFSLIKNMTERPNGENKWSLYTGEDDYMKTRQFRTANGFNESYVVYLIY
jgi:hypothetical protein